MQCKEGKSGAIGTIHQKKVAGYSIAWVRQDFTIFNCSVAAFDLFTLDMGDYLKKNPQIKKY